jgi:hypothetical protein
VKKYKTHNTYTRLQAIVNENESATYAGPPTSSSGFISTNNETYIPALKEMLACLMTEHESAFAVTTRAANRTPINMLATSLKNDFCLRLMTEMKMKWQRYWQWQRQQQRRVPALEELALEAVALEKLAQCGRGHKNGSGLPLCPHCGKNGKYKPCNRFSLLDISSHLGKRGYLPWE